jgi:hypothetical protein
MVFRLAASAHVVSRCHAFDWPVDSRSFPTRPSLLLPSAAPFPPLALIVFPNEISFRWIASRGLQTPRFRLARGFPANLDFPPSLLGNPPPPLIRSLVAFPNRTPPCLVVARGLQTPRFQLARGSPAERNPSFPPSLLGNPSSRSLMVYRLAASTRVVSGCHAFDWLAGSDPPFSPPSLGSPLPSFGSYRISQRNIVSLDRLTWSPDATLSIGPRIPGHLDFPPSLLGNPPSPLTRSLVAFPIDISSCRIASRGLQTPRFRLARGFPAELDPPFPPSSEILLLHSSAPLSRSQMISRFAVSAHVVSGCHAFDWLASSRSFPTRPSLLLSSAAPFLPPSLIAFPNEMSSRWPHVVFRCHASDWSTVFIPFRSSPPW